MVRAKNHNQLMERLELAEARVRRLEAQAEVQLAVVRELVAETGATDQQLVNATLRACGFKA